MIETAEEIYRKHLNKEVYYKGLPSGYIAGYCEHYLIVGFLDFKGCIKEFSNRIVYQEARYNNPQFRYNSYRFAKPKNISIDE